MDWMSIGRWLVLTGILLTLVGAGLWCAGRMGLPLGRFPGDIHIAHERFSFHFPVATCIVASIVLTVLINVLLRLFHR